jgi:hypothetical protein
MMKKRDKEKVKTMWFEVKIDFNKKFRKEYSLKESEIKRRFTEALREAALYELEDETIGMPIGSVRVTWDGTDFEEEGGK